LSPLDSPPEDDLLVVGSGPGAAHAAQEAVTLGLRVHLVEVGFEVDPGLAASVPEAPFDELRRTDARQARYFIGDNLEGVPTGPTRVGSQLTPPRQFITKDVERWLPFASDTFQPMQSLAFGGLGAGWGAGPHVFEPAELEAAGLPPDDMAPFYQAAADEIGINAAPDEDNGRFLLGGLGGLQPAFPSDTNAAALHDAYRRKRESLRAAGLHLGRAPAAILSEDRRASGFAAPRRANPLFDMDFYTDRSRSVYRPRYTIESLLGHPRFRRTPGHLALEFRQVDGGGVELLCRRLADGALVRFPARRLALGAGALGSARIALRSLRAYDRRTPLLCNPYHYMPTVQLRMLGRPVADRRHSLGQLLGVFLPPGGGEDRVIAAFFSYRSLLLFKLVKEMPLPPVLGLLVARALVTSLTIAGVHHADRPGPGKWLELRHGAAGGAGLDHLAGHYEAGPGDRARIGRSLEAFRRCLRQLGCVPLAMIDPGMGASIHYAGTIPRTAAASGAVSSDSLGRLHEANRVVVVDSSAWTFLPAKGPSLTIMANARRVVRRLAAELTG
jgi:choline dehydrogenase-like flavoprotein